jgi:transcriptional regulator with XRE-family HTH domain
MTKLRKKRLEMGASIFAVASKTGVRESMMSAIENVRSICYPKHRKALADFYGVPESELFNAAGFALEAGDE